MTTHEPMHEAKKSTDVTNFEPKELDKSPHMEAGGAPSCEKLACPGLWVGQRSSSCRFLCCVTAEEVLGSVVEVPDIRVVGVLAPVQLLTFG